MVAVHGNPAEYRAKADECGRQANDLADSVGSLSLLASVVADAWQGEAGESLRSAIDAQVKRVEAAQERLRDAAAALVRAAQQLEAEIEREQKRREAEAKRRLGDHPH